MIPHYDSKIDINKTKKQTQGSTVDHSEKKMPFISSTDVTAGTVRGQGIRQRCPLRVMMTCCHLASWQETATPPGEENKKMSEVCFFILCFTTPSSLRKTSIWKGIVQITSVGMRKWKTNCCWLKRSKACFLFFFLNLHNNMMQDNCNGSTANRQRAACLHMFWIEI